MSKTNFTVPVPTFNAHGKFDLNNRESSTKLTSEIAPSSAMMVIFSFKQMEHKRQLSGISYDFKPYILAVLLLTDALDSADEGSADEIDLDDVGVEVVSSSSETDDAVQAESFFVE